MRRLVVILFLLGLTAPADAAAQERRRERDSQAAREAVERGEALPLAEILARARGGLPGEIVGIELERRGSAWIYEFKVIDAAGRRREVHIDARTGKVLRRERH